VRAFLPSRVESFDAGRAGAQPYRVTTASAECGKVRQIVIVARRWDSRNPMIKGVAPKRRRKARTEVTVFTE
jgi:hypothetical protein